MGMGVKVRVWGDYALFSRPEMKVERCSYDVITPSAARGILEAIYWHPGMKWCIDKIYVKKPVKFTSVRRNEVKSKVSASKVLEAYNGGMKPLYLSSKEEIVQRASLLLTAGRTRLRKVAKQCTNYGRRVQNSVFECILDSAQSVALKGILSDIIDKNKDSLRFYYLGNNYQTKIEHVGIERGIPVDQPLIM